MNKIFKQAREFAALGFVLALCLSGFATNVYSDEISPQELRRPRPIRDGFALFAADGVVVKGEDLMCYFIPDQELFDGRVKIDAGTKIPALRSSGLDKIFQSASPKATRQPVRIWGRITSYERENFIYISYYLPMVNRSAQELQEKETVEETSQEEVSEVLPEDVLKKLRPTKFIDVKQLRTSMLKQQDVILADRSGFIHKTEDDKYVFVLDAFGQNVSDMSFELLKCEALKRAIRLKEKSALPMRFRIAGTATQHEGKLYILLQRTMRVYNNGNFFN